MGGQDDRGRRRESRMTITTYVAAANGQVHPLGPQSHVVRPRDPLTLPTHPLRWPPCTCPQCRKPEVGDMNSLH